MIRLRRFSNPLAAELAATHLRRHGVAATVIGDHLRHTLDLIGAGLVRGVRWPQLELVILDDAQRAEAERLLLELEQNPPEFDEAWEEESRPDLSRLDPMLHAVACPGCLTELTLDESLERCPECGMGIDVVDLVVEHHGPEALEACYESEGAPTLDALIRALPRAIPCADCGFDLREQGVRGRCPSCGRLYDMENTIRR